MLHDVRYLQGKETTSSAAKADVRDVKSWFNMYDKDRTHWYVRVYQTSLSWFHPMLAISFFHVPNSIYTPPASTTLWQSPTMKLKEDLIPHLPSPPIPPSTLGYVSWLFILPLF